METILTNEYPISEEKFKTILAEKIKPYEKAFIDKINDLLEKLGKLVSYKKIVSVSEKGSI